MTFKIYNQGYNPQELIRRVGYKPRGVSERGELDCVKPLGADYPRFHIYMKEEKDVIIFNLHLDQKKPSYEGSTAHGGDYDSETVRDEVQRVKDAILR